MSEKEVLEPPIDTINLCTIDVEALFKDEKYLHIYKHVGKDKLRSILEKIPFFYFDGRYEKTGTWGPTFPTPETFLKWREQERDLVILKHPNLIEIGHLLPRPGGILIKDLILIPYYHVTKMCEMEILTLHEIPKRECIHEKLKLKIKE